MPNRRLLPALAVLLLPGLALAQPVPAPAPGTAPAQGTEDVTTLLRGAPGNRTGGATRGISPGPGFAGATTTPTPPVAPPPAVPTPQR